MAAFRVAGRIEWDPTLVTASLLIGAMLGALALNRASRAFFALRGNYVGAGMIVRAVLGLGKSLSIPVLAEGVETREHLIFLEGEDCAEVQGYLFGRPQPLEDIANLVFDRQAPAQTPSAVARQFAG